MWVQRWHSANHTFDLLIIKIETRLPEYSCLRPCSFLPFELNLAHHANLDSCCYKSRPRNYAYDAKNLYYNSPCLSMFANCRSQFLLDRLGKCLKLFVSTDTPEFALQLGLAIFLYMRKTPKTSGKVFI